MKKSTLSLLVATALSVTLGMSGCSSDDTSGEAPSVGFNGTFVDGPTNGINFSCEGPAGATVTGVTKNYQGSDGWFGVCGAGKVVTFSLGNLVLGSTTPTANSIFRPRDIATAEKAKEIASLVLSSSTRVSINGVETVTVSPAAVATINATYQQGTKITNLTPVAVEASARAAAASDPEVTYATPDEAESHMDEVDAQIAQGAISAPEQPSDTVPTGSN